MAWHRIQRAVDDESCLSVRGSEAGNETRSRALLAEGQAHAQPGSIMLGSSSVVGRAAV